VRHDVFAEHSPHLSPNSSLILMPNASAIRIKFLSDGFLRAVSMPAKYVR